MSIQPTLTPEQQAQLCPACAHGGTSRYCIPGGTCYCQHEACPAYPTSPQRRDPWGNVVGLESRSGEAESDRIGVAKTNGPGLAPETVLATPIRVDEQEDYPEW